MLISISVILCPLGRGSDVGKVKLFFLLISMSLFLDVCSFGVLETLNWILEISESYFGLYVNIKAVFMWKNRKWNFLFYHLVNYPMSHIYV